MPTYVYECGKCESTFEVEQRMSDEALKTCECGGPVKRIIQPVGVMFKGSGFYVNDSKPAPATPAAADCSGEPATCAACAPATTAPAVPAENSTN